MRMEAGPIGEYPVQALFFNDTWEEAFTRALRCTPGPGCRIMVRKMANGTWWIFREVKR